MGKNKSFNKIGACLLSVILILGILPISVTASTNTVDTVSPDGIIIAFAALDTDTATQTVPFATDITALNLPAVLTATVKVTSPSDSINNVDNTSGSAMETNVTETSTLETNIEIPVTWDCTYFDGYMPGQYTFTAKIGEEYQTLTDPPVIIVTVEEANAAPQQVAPAYWNVGSAEIIRFINDFDPDGSGTAYTSGALQATALGDNYDTVLVEGTVDAPTEVLFMSFGNAGLSFPKIIWKAVYNGEVDFSGCITDEFEISDGGEISKVSIDNIYMNISGVLSQFDFHVSGGIVGEIDIRAKTYPYGRSNDFATGKIRVSAGNVESIFIEPQLYQDTDIDITGGSVYSIIAAISTNVTVSNTTIDKAVIGTGVHRPGRGNITVSSNSVIYGGIIGKWNEINVTDSEVPTIGGYGDVGYNTYHGVSSVKIVNSNVGDIDGYKFGDEVSQISVIGSNVNKVTNGQIAIEDSYISSNVSCGIVSAPVTLSNCTVVGNIAANTNTLTITNGCSITGDISGSTVIFKDSTLDGGIRSSGDIDLSGSTVSGVVQIQSGTIYGGTINSSIYGNNASASAVRGINITLSGTTVNGNGTAVSATGVNSSLSVNSGTNVTGNVYAYSSLDINGGIISGNVFPVLSVTVNDGTINGAISNLGTSDSPQITINGGTITANNPIDSEYATVNINGGTIIAENDTRAVNASNVSIAGGTIQGQVYSKDYLTVTEGEITAPNNTLIGGQIIVKGGSVRASNAGGYVFALDTNTSLERAAIYAAGTLSENVYDAGDYPVAEVGQNDSYVKLVGGLERFAEEGICFETNADGDTEIVIPYKDGLQQPLRFIWNMNVSDLTIDPVVSLHLKEVNSEKALPLKWGSNQFKNGSGTYNNELAITAMYLSNEAYFSEIMAQQALEELGFDNVKSYNYDLEGLIQDKVAYSFGSKLIKTGSTPYYLIAVAIRGTHGLNEWLSDFGIFNLTYGSAPLSFASAETDLRVALNSYLATYATNISYKKKFFIAGHSRGGAITYLLANKLLENSTANNEDIFAYGFASPKMGISLGTEVNSYNTVNLDDIVTWVLPHLPRYGNTKNFWMLDIQFLQSFYELTGEDLIVFQNRGILESKFTGHYPSVYMAHLLRNRNGGTSADTPKGTLFSITIECPVDVEVYDGQNNIVAQITDNQVDRNMISSVIAVVDQDKKYLYWLDEEDYTIKLIGTDNGEMTFTVERFDEEGSSARNTSKVFNNVVLENGKLFTSPIAAEQTVADTILYTTNENGDIMGTVSTDGKETAITPTQYSLTVTDGTGSGKYEIEEVVTISANPAPSDQVFKEWTITPEVKFLNGTSAVNSTASFSMPAQNVTATATYEATTPTPNQYSIKVITNGNGTVNTSAVSAAQGEQVTVTATPNRNYIFNGWYEDGSRVTGAGATYTFEVTKNRTLEARFTYSPPSGGNDNDNDNDRDNDNDNNNSRNPRPSNNTIAWSSVRDKINAAKPGETVTIATSGVTSVPAYIFTALKGKDITLTLNIGSYSWTFDGKTVKDIPAIPASYSLGISRITNKAISDLAQNKDVALLELAQKTAFPFTATLEWKLGITYKDSALFLYYYNETDKVLEYCADVLADKNGTVKLTLPNSSKYALLSEKLTEETEEVSELSEPPITEPEPTPEPNPTPTPEPSPTPTPISQQVPPTPLILNESTPVDEYGFPPFIFQSLEDTGYKYGLIKVNELMKFTGATSVWDNATGTATITGLNSFGLPLEIILTNNKPTIVVNGVTYDLAEYAGAPELSGLYTVHNAGGALYLPCRAVAAAFGLKLEWQEETETVIITK